MAGGLFALGAGARVLTACSGDDESDAVNDEWQARAAALEGSQASVYTAADPGPWTGKEGTHVPTLTPGASARAALTHGQTVGEPDAEDHFITTIYVKDQDGVVIHLVELDGSEETPETTFTPPAGTTQMTAYANCNLHGLWRSEPISL